MRVVTRFLLALSTVGIVGCLLAIAWVNSPLPTVEKPALLSLEDNVSLDDSGPIRINNSNRSLLELFDEVSFRKANGSYREEYRLILIPTFNRPVAVRISNQSGKTTITKKFLGGMGGYEIGELVEQHERILVPEEWEKIENAIAAVDFWQIQSIDRNEPLINDGATWIFQGRIDQNVHNVKRVWPTGKLRELYTLILATASIEEEYSGYF